MRNYLDGAILRPVEKGHSGSVKELARKFLVYGAYSEIFARDTGFNRFPHSVQSPFFRRNGKVPENHPGMILILLIRIDWKGRLDQVSQR